MPKIDFQPMKILKYSKQLEQIKRGEVPNPVMLEVDPTNYCNFGCSWCSSGYHLWEDKKPKELLEPEGFKHILNFIDHIKTVEGIYWCGGGEPSLNPNLVSYMKEIKARGINNYITNNGSMLFKYGSDFVDLCKWVAVSVNSGTEEMWRKIFKTKMNYDKYLDGLKQMNIYNRSVNSLTYPVETVYKHTFDTETYVDIERAYFKAIELGFTNVLIKPVDLFIYKRDENKQKFSEVWSESVVKSVNKMIENIKHYNQINPAIELDCGGFYGMFEVDKQAHLNFDKCWTNMLAPVFGSNGDIYICCVRRSEKIVGKWNDGNLINYWGSQEHKKKIWDFDVKKECPMRCKMGRYNEIYQQVYVEDRFSSGHI